MALKIKLKRFTDSSGDPSTSDLEVGEVGINPVQKKILINKKMSLKMGLTLQKLKGMKNLIKNMMSLQRVKRNKTN